MGVRDFMWSLWLRSLRCSLLPVALGQLVLGGDARIQGQRRQIGPLPQCKPCARTGNKSFPVGFTAWRRKKSMRIWVLFAWGDLPFVPFSLVLGVA